jgi:hypothetical protein
MSYYRATRLGCRGLLARGVLVGMLGLAVLVFVANRSWFETKALNRIYGNRPAIHVGKQFTPGASAVEDGVRQTAVLVGGTPHVRVTSPTTEWLRRHKDALCDDGGCIAAATSKKFAGGGGLDLGTALAALLVCFLGWTLLTDDGRLRPYRRYR